MVSGYCPFAFFSRYFSMSHKVFNADDTATIASISTPVRACATTLQVARMPLSSISKATSTRSSAIWWQCGINRWVCFAAVIAATSATAKGSPFLTSRRLMTSMVAARNSILPSATASLRTIGFSPTSTIPIGKPPNRRISPSFLPLRS